jgi:hypothetical protein
VIDGQEFLISMCVPTELIDEAFGKFHQNDSLLLSMFDAQWWPWFDFGKTEKAHGSINA